MDKAKRLQNGFISFPYVGRAPALFLQYCIFHSINVRFNPLSSDANEFIVQIIETETIQSEIVNFINEELEHYY
jgi:hypothetical protein